MNLPLLIAKRYFFSRKKKSFINIISIVAMLGVMVGVMALVIVLSVFNGMEDLQRGLFHSFDSDLRVTAIKGKNFDMKDVKLTDLQKLSQVKTVTQVIEENALLRYQDKRMVVNLKGVEDNFLAQSQLNKAIIDGRLKLREDGRMFAIIGQGVSYMLSISIADFFTPIEAWYPHNTGVKAMNLMSDDAFNRLDIMPGGIFAIEQDYDYQYVIVPLSFAQNLFEYGTKRTAIEIQVSDYQQVESIKKAIASLLGANFKIENRDEQHATLFRAIHIEKLFVFITLAFIIAIASFNIFFSLSMLAIEKKEDVSVMLAMGATPVFIKKIFLFEGCLVAFIGAVLGLLLGYGLCFLQAQYGLVKMGTTSLLIDAYPIKTEFWDFFNTAIVVVVITLLASYFPAKKAVSIR